MCIQDMYLEERGLDEASRDTQVWSRRGVQDRALDEATIYTYFSTTLHTHTSLLDYIPILPLLDTHTYSTRLDTHTSLLD